MVKALLLLQCLVPDDLCTFGLHVVPRALFLQLSLQSASCQSQHLAYLAHRVAHMCMVMQLLMRAVSQQQPGKAVAMPVDHSKQR